MKYLLDEQLAQWTSALTGVPIGQSRILHGRLEAYTMKRVSSDKKYAAVLGEKYVEQIHQDQEWAAALPRSTRKRSQSAGLLEESLVTASSPPPPTKRPRSCSLDDGLSKSITALGDFNEQGTRRLMTDLVLTLNASFPDYDFASIKPTAFTKMSTKKAINRINEILSEWAALGGGQEHNLNAMWVAVDRSIRLKECDVFLFTPSEDASFLLATDGMASSGDYLDFDYDDDDDAEDGSNRQSVLWSFYYLFVNKNLKRILLFSCAESMRNVVSISDADNDNEVERFVPFSDAGAADNLDFDLDPESTTAGGIPFSTVA
ncbi:hypothetical protein ACA910_021583 [Epithemia clementina (nom. ined.)]